MPYMEGEFPTVVYGDRNNSNGSWGGDWSWIIGLAIIGALFGNGGFGFGGGGFGGGHGFYPYGCGAPATQSDLAAGFNNSAVLSSLNDIKLGQQQAINYNNQGFAGLNTAIASGFAGVDNAVCTLGYNIQAGFNGVENAVCTLGYQNQAGFNAISSQIASCCCDMKTMNLENRYLNEKQTCEIVAAINAGNQRLVDIYTADKMEALRAENMALKGRISDDYQADRIISKLSPCPSPAYIVPNPNCCYNYNVTQGCGCNNL